MLLNLILDDSETAFISTKENGHSYIKINFLLVSSLLNKSYFLK